MRRRRRAIVTLLMLEWAFTAIDALRPKKIKSKGTVSPAKALDAQTMQVVVQGFGLQKYAGVATTCELTTTAKESARLESTDLAASEPQPEHLNEIQDANNVS